MPPCPLPFGGACRGSSNTRRNPFPGGRVLIPPVLRLQRGVVVAPFAVSSKQRTLHRSAPRLQNTFLWIPDAALAALVPLLGSGFPIAFVSACYACVVLCCAVIGVVRLCCAVLRCAMVCLVRCCGGVVGFGRPLQCCGGVMLCCGCRLDLPVQCCVVLWSAWYAGVVPRSALCALQVPLSICCVGCAFLRFGGLRPSVLVVLLVLGPLR